MFRAFTISLVLATSIAALTGCQSSAAEAKTAPQALAPNTKATPHAQASASDAVAASPAISMGIPCWRTALIPSRNNLYLLQINTRIGPGGCDSVIGSMKSFRAQILPRTQC